MFDIEGRLYRRLMTAIAATALTAACGTSGTGNTTTTSATDSGSGTVTDTAGSADTTTTADSGSATDAAAPVDASSPTDTNTTTAKDAGTANPQDAGSPTSNDAGTTSPSDAGTTNPTDAGTTNPVDAGTAADSGSTGTDAGGPVLPPIMTPAPVCKNGKNATKTCYTTKQLLYAASPNHPFGKPLPPDQTKYPMPPHGCPIPGVVKDGCCNPATGFAGLEGDKCCYYYCVGACCGRPLLIGGHARLADAVARIDWADHRESDAAVPDAKTAAGLRDAWLADAAAEHASIASFARFSMDLLVCGAPPELVTDAHRAAIDEVEHARLCFGIASSLADGVFGPGPLDLAGAQPSATLADAVAAAVVEGCIGETTAALLAQTAAGRARHGHVRDALATIAEDETRHAELAWRFVRWAIDKGDYAVLAAAQVAFEEALAAPIEVPAGHDPTVDGFDATSWNAWGRLTASQWHDVCERARLRVIKPCMDALLGDRATCASVASIPAAS